MISRYLAGRSALVTGSTSGIGFGIARALAERGASVMLNGFGEPGEIEALRRQLAEQQDVRVTYSDADVSNPAAVRELVTASIETFGALDVLVNNAGIQHTAPVESFPEANWDAILSINLSSNFHAIKAALPGMRERNWGRIVNIASVHGLVASRNKAAYVAAKHGVLGLTKVVALETATTGITCNAICPGWVLTPLVQTQIEELAARENLVEDQARTQLLSEKQPSLEFVTTSQIGWLAAFLCSEDAAQIRGAALTIDGGWLSQ